MVFQAMSTYRRALAVSRGAARRMLSTRTLIPTQAGHLGANEETTPAPCEGLWWSDVWAPREEWRLHSSVCGQQVSRSACTPAASLAGPLALQGSAHEITLTIRNGDDVIIGVAEAVSALSSPWRGTRAWGVSASGGEPMCLPAMPVEQGLTAGGAAASAARAGVEGALGDSIAVAPTSDIVEMSIRIDLIRRHVTFVRNGERLGTVTRIPTELRPWALFQSRDAAADGRATSVRLESHSIHAVPTFNVNKLSQLVEGLSEVKQALALAWCEWRDLEDLAELTQGPGGGASALVDALNLPAEQSDKLLLRLEVLCQS